MDLFDNEKHLRYLQFQCVSYVFQKQYFRPCVRSQWYSACYSWSCPTSLPPTYSSQQGLQWLRELCIPPGKIYTSTLVTYQVCLQSRILSVSHYWLPQYMQGSQQDGGLEVLDCVHVGAVDGGELCQACQQEHSLVIKRDSLQVSQCCSRWTVFK